MCKFGRPRTLRTDLQPRSRVWRRENISSVVTQRLFFNRSLINVRRGVAVIHTDHDLNYYKSLFTSVTRFAADISSLAMTKTLRFYPPLKITDFIVISVK